jgi:hypothetical protein
MLWRLASSLFLGLILSSIDPSAAVASSLARRESPAIAAGEATAQPELAPWPDLSGSLFSQIATVAGVSPTLEPDTRAGDAVQVLLYTSWGDAALVRVESVEGVQLGRLTAYWIASDQWAIPTDLRAAWERPLNPVEAAAIARVLDRFRFWRTLGLGRQSMRVDGERLVREEPNCQSELVDEGPGWKEYELDPDCPSELVSDGSSMLVEAKIGDRYHYAEWGGGTMWEDLRRIGQFVLSLAGIDDELWGLDKMLGPELTPGAMADEQLDKLRIGIGRGQGAEEEPQ